jgi:hypothetical protein
MIKLHIVQGDEVGDKKLLEKAAQNHMSTRSWIVPKTAKIGDEVVIYVGRYGFFATARIKTQPRARPDWPNRYSSGLKSIKLIEPSISLAIIQRRVPKLEWAKYPRSITTPAAHIATQVRKLIRDRRKPRDPDLDDDELPMANIDELRKEALLSARPSGKRMKRIATYYGRSLRIHAFIMRRADGHCEGCGDAAPFIKADGSPYLEPHHTTNLADDGPDHPATVIGLCPNCHRRAHYGKDADIFNCVLIKKAKRLWSTP